MARNPYLAAMMSAALLIAMSAILFRPEVRFIYGQEPVLPNLDFSEGAQGWRARGKPSVLETTQSKTAHIPASGDVPYLGRIITEPQRFRFLRVRAQVRSEHLEGTEPWHGGTLSLASYGGGLQYTKHWPRRVIRLQGSNDWETVEQIFPVSPFAEQLFLVAYAAGHRGHFEFKNLAVVEAEERTPVEYARYGLIALWLGLWVWLLKRLLAQRERAPSRLVVFILANLLVVAGVTPQPYLNDVLKVALFRGQDVFFAGKDALVAITKTPQVGNRQIGNRQTGGEPGITARAAERSKDANTADTPSRSDKAVSGAPASESKPRQTSPTRKQTGAQEGSPRAPPPGNEHRYWRPNWDYLDKTEHLAAFAILAFLTGLAYRQHSARRRLTALGMLAASIQTLQLFSITREPDIADLQADLTGAVLGTLVAGALLLALKRARSFRKRRAPEPRYSPEAPAPGGSSDP